MYEENGWVSQSHFWFGRLRYNDLLRKGNRLLEIFIKVEGNSLNKNYMDNLNSICRKFNNIFDR